MKAASSGVFVDDFDIDPEFCSVFDDRLFEAGVGPALGDGWVRLLCLVEEVYPQGVFGEAGGGDGHGEDQADRVGEDASLPAYDLLRGIGSLAGYGHVGGGLDALGVDDGGRRLGLSAFLYAGQGGEVVIEVGEDSLVAPGGVVEVDGAVAGEVVREVFSRDSGAVEVEDRVEHVAQVDFRRLSGGATFEAGIPPGRQRRFDQGPSGVGQVAGVRLAITHGTA